MSNLLKRTVFGALFVVVMVASVLFSKLLFAAVALLVMVIGLHEFYRMTIPAGEMKVESILLDIAGVCFFILYTLSNVGVIPSEFVCLTMIPLLAIMVMQLWKPGPENPSAIAFLYTAFIYIAMPVGLVSRVVIFDGEYDGWLLMSFFAVIWLSDVGAYCLGTAFGQKPDSIKLAPKISPKKSLWGLFGGILMGMIVAVVLHYTGCLKVSLGHSLALGAILSVFGVIGDLVESWWKRRAGVKDSGNVIPGHGGILDRFDSSLLAIPMAAIYLQIFGLLG